MSHLGAAARRTLVEYFMKTSLNGFGLLYFIRRRRYQRILWFLFIALGIMFASFVVLITLLDIFDHPTVTALSAQGLPTTSTPVPAMAICSTNKLSRLAMQQYAQQLAQSTNISNVEQWLALFPLFAGYFAASLVPAANASALQSALGKHWTTETDPRTRLLSLAPTCKDLLLSCSLGDELRNCTEIFHLTATGDGFCCVFNYRKRVYFVHGKHMGLNLFLNASRADDFHMPRNRRSAGFIFHIFRSDGGLPNPGTGALRSMHIAAGELAFIEIHAVAQESTQRLRDYSVSQRGCNFAEEGGGQAQCLSQCRMGSAISNCGCIPFPYERRANHRNISYCTLADIKCLQRESGIWSPTLPQCIKCMPQCSDFRYEFRKSVFPLLNVTNRMEQSALTVYYRQPRVPLYQHNELYNWFQILSIIGGVVGVSIGCSFISGFEIIYFMLIRFYQNYRKLQKGEIN